MLETEKEKLIYLAGIIEGEGTIVIAKQKIYGKKFKNRLNDSYSLRIDVVNTNQKLIEWCKQEFGGSIHKDNNNRKKTVYVWTLASKESYKLLKRLLPFFLFKDDQAQLGIEFYNKCNRGHNPSRIPIWLNAKREDYYQRMKDLHL